MTGLLVVCKIYYASYFSFRQNIHMTFTHSEAACYDAAQNYHFGVASPMAFDLSTEAGRKSFTLMCGPEGSDCTK